jgi:hypothetical protein
MGGVRNRDGNAELPAGKLGEGWLDVDAHIGRPVHQIGDVG